MLAGVEFMSQAFVKATWSKTICISADYHRRSNIHTSTLSRMLYDYKPVKLAGTMMFRGICLYAPTGLQGVSGHGQQSTYL